MHSTQLSPIESTQYRVVSVALIGSCVALAAAVFALADAQRALGALLFALTSCCFLSFGWGIRRFFRKPEQLSVGVFCIKYVGTALALLHLALLGLALPRAGLLHAAALPLSVLSLLLYWSALDVNQKRPLHFAYAGDSPLHLVRSGPYGWIRHPFYSSYILSFSTAPLALGSAWLALTAVLMAVVYLRSALGEEQNFERSALAEQYRAYRRTTGMLVPRLRRSHDAQRLLDCE